MIAIRTSAISKSYRHFQVIREASFELMDGDCYALFGPNGAGKTTMLKILATLQKPSDGRIEILGFDAVEDRNRVREQILLMAHGTYLYADLDAVENIRFGLALRNLTAADREIKLALDRVEIGPFSDFKVRYYSEGMKRRLSIARAMLIRPRILLLDEPYSSLDERGAALMNQFIREQMERGGAVFMTSHNRQQSAQVATRAGLLAHGHLRPLALPELTGSHDLF